MLPTSDHVMSSHVALESHIGFLEGDNRALVILLVGKIASILGVMSFLASIPSMIRLWRKGSTKGFNSSPFLAGMLSIFLWLRYSLVIQDPIMIYVNLCGWVIFFLYNLFFVYMSHRRVTDFKRLLFILCLQAALTVACKSMDMKDNLFYSGFLAAGSGVVFALSPLTTLKKVIREKNTESLPFLLILCTCLVSSLWFTYGVLLNDQFLMIPNGLNAFITGLQLILFCIYPDKSSSRKNSRDLLPLLEDTEGVHRL